MPYESEKLRAEFENSTIEKIIQLDQGELLRDGKVREQTVKARVNQWFFRTMVLAAYNSTCCITGLQNPELLIAGHIKPWAVDEKTRLNPRNGLAMNALHDRAFDAGLITITPDYRIMVSSSLKKEQRNKCVQDYFVTYDRKEIILPSRFLPDREFLEYHNNERFIP